jgi:predicted metal-dependent enzyme (double-stranded beta helix superfamily)
MTVQASTPSALEAFIDCLDHLVRTSDESQEDFWPRLGQAMQQLVATDDWLPQSMTRPHPQYYQQYCLYADPEDRFSVVSFVWGPGQATPIHNHTVWGVIGVIQGAETDQRYEITLDGVPTPVGQEERLDCGDIGFVSPTIGDVHRVSNAFADRVSISIHAYGGNIGKINRHVFPEQGGQAKAFVSGYSDPSAQ